MIGQCQRNGRHIHQFRLEKDPFPFPVHDKDPVYVSAARHNILVGEKIFLTTESFRAGLKTGEIRIVSRTLDRE